MVAGVGIEHYQVPSIDGFPSLLSLQSAGIYIVRILKYLGRERREEAKGNSRGLYNLEQPYPYA